MIKYTPGPWTSREMGSEGARIIPDYGDIRERGKTIAEVRGRDTLTDFANARVMSAAPELLEYAKMEGEIDELREEIHRDEKRPGSNHGEILAKYQRLDNMVDAAQTLRLSAIRKAEED